MHCWPWVVCFVHGALLLFASGHGEHHSPKYEQQVRERVLEGYDPMVAPFDPAAETAPTVAVALGLRITKVMGFDIPQAVMRLAGTLRLAWNDPRLSWDPAAHGNVTTVFAYCSWDRELNEIWNPVVELWNLETSLKDSLGEKPAYITSAGDVMWSRSGTFAAICNYSRVTYKWPFDRPTCTFTVGTWAASKAHVVLVPMATPGACAPGICADGWEIGDIELDKVNSYAELIIHSIELSQEDHVFPAYSDEVYPTLRYKVTLERSGQNAVMQKIVVPQMLLTFVSFLPMLTSPSSGERLGVGITAMLSIIATDFVVSESLPRTNKAMVIYDLYLICLFFSAMALVESVVAIHLFYKRRATIVPPGAWHCGSRRRTRTAQVRQLKTYCRWMRRTYVYGSSGSGSDSDAARPGPGRRRDGLRRLRRGAKGRRGRAPSPEPSPFGSFRAPAAEAPAGDAAPHRPAADGGDAGRAALRKDSALDVDAFYRDARRGNGYPFDCGPREAPGPGPGPGPDGAGARVLLVHPKRTLVMRVPRHWGFREFAEGVQRRFGDDDRHGHNDGGIRLTFQVWLQDFDGWCDLDAATYDDLAKGRSVKVQALPFRVAARADSGDSGPAGLCATRQLQYAATRRHWQRVARAVDLVSFAMFNAAFFMACVALYLR